MQPAVKIPTVPGIYISIPFCKSKCSYCNFASGVFSRDRMQRFVERVAQDMEAAPQLAATLGGRFDGDADTIYLGGGTPTILEPEQLASLFHAFRQNFHVTDPAEITVECAPGTLSDPVLGVFRRVGVNRVSLGVQSFVDQEARSVARLHDRETTLSDIARLRANGISNMNVDLIAGLPHQTEVSWERSLDDAIASGVPHVSIYMLEVDDDSRLGRELIAGGTRYHAHHVPDDDLTAAMYQRACERLNAAGIAQYEISNFARPGFESKHNLKYWMRQPYFGFGLDAHSMLPASAPTQPQSSESIRFATSDDLEKFLAAEPHTVSCVTAAQAEEEKLFLGLRLNRGIELEVDGAPKRGSYEESPASELSQAIRELLADGLLERTANRIRLTDRGRMISNEVFARLLVTVLTES